MGKGGRSQVLREETDEAVWQSPYNPLDPKAPKLPTKGEIKAVIPKECFERSYLHSMYFVSRDTIIAIGIVLLTKSCLSTEIPSNLFSLEGLTWFAGWNMYAFWMGATVMGHWVLAHECGHGAFSPSQMFNDFWGFIMHQALLVPYFAWQYTHAKHHRRTAHLVDGESHVPSTRDECGLFMAIHEVIGDGPYAAFEVFTHCVLGWPLYLMGLASTGRLANDGSFLQKGEIMDHFRTNSKFYPSNGKLDAKIMVSAIGVIATLGLLLKLSLDHGFLTVFLWYTAPYLWVNFWLVTYTWLQHNDPSVPQYGPDEWNWVRGALTTIDRPYGIFCWFHHKIGSTHVAHHLFHEMPFYRADEATAAIKAFLEPKGLYNYDPTPWYKAMWRIAHDCHFMEDMNGVQYWKSFNDKTLPPQKKKAA